MKGNFVFLIVSIFVFISCEKSSELVYPTKPQTFSGFWQGENFGIHLKFVCEEENGIITGTGFVDDGSVTEYFTTLTGSHIADEVSLTINGEPKEISFTFNGYFDGAENVYGLLGVGISKPRLPYIWIKRPTPIMK